MTINLEGRDDAPVVGNDALSADPTGTTNLNILANDFDPDGSLNLATLEIVVRPSNGSATVLANGQVAYTPNPGFRGVDQFTYRISDNTGNISSEASVSVAINRKPLAVADSATVIKNGAVNINILNNDSDPDGNSTINRGSIVIVTPPPTGTAIIQSDGSIRFVPAANVTGPVVFRYTIADTSGAVSDPANVTVTVVESLAQNQRLRFDVNDDGFVTSLDALIVINDLQTQRCANDTSVLRYPSLY